MRLISMTDFVLEQSNKMFVLESGREYTFQEYTQVVVSYAQFFKKSLTLGMFVPCDEKSNVLEKPKDVNSFSQLALENHERDMQIYIQAKEKVLFEGFRPNAWGASNDKLEIDIHFDEDGSVRLHDRSKKKYTDGMWSDVKNVEDLIKYSPELTATLLKQIGL